MIGLEIDSRTVTRLGNTLLRQIPYATYRALNRMILEMQRYQRYHQSRVFTIRQKQYWQQSVKIPRNGFATIKNLNAHMLVDPKGNVPKFETWRRQEYGGTRKPVAGRKKLAIPPQEESRYSSVGLTYTSRGLIPKALRPKRLKRTFVIPFGGNKLGLFRRLGRRQKGYTKTAPGQRFALRNDPNIELMYILHESAEVEDVFEWFGNARKNFDSKWNRYYEDELVKAFKTARLARR